MEGNEDGRVQVHGGSAKVGLRAVGIIWVPNIFCFHSPKLTLHLLHPLLPVTQEADLRELRPQAPLLSGFPRGPTGGQHRQEMRAE